MLDGLLKVVAAVLPAFLKRDNEAARLREDKKLADAIQRGDWKMVSKIMEKRRHYKTLIILLLLVLPLVSSCRSPNISSVPLTNDQVVFKITPGVYYSLDGYPHTVTNGWVVSEADVYRIIQDMGEENSLANNWKFQIMKALDNGIVITLVIIGGACAVVILAFGLARLTSKRR